MIKVLYFNLKCVLYLQLVVGSSDLVRLLMKVNFWVFNEKFKLLKIYVEKFYVMNVQRVN